MAYDFLLGEDRPLVDARPGIYIAPEKLRGFGAAVSEEAADGEAFGYGEAFVGFEGGDFAEGELGEEGGGEVGLVVGVVGGVDYGETA